MKLTGLDGRGAFLTGANGGIGLALTRALLDSGTRVFATDLSVDKVGSIDSEMLATACLDVTDSCAVDSMVAEAEKFLDGIDFGR